jgi:hypothetical protein
MEVHAHTHTPRKKWTHYFWEFLMLFLAVFCGFLAEYQLEHKIEKDRAKEFAKALYNDIVSDTANMQLIIKETEENLAYLDTLTDLMNRLSIEKEKIPGAVLYYYANRSRGGTIFTVKTSTLDQLKNSGSLRLLKKPELIRLFAVYDQAILVQLSREDNDLLIRDEMVQCMRQLFSYTEHRKLTRLLDRFPASRDSLLKIDLPLLSNEEKKFSDLSYALQSRKNNLERRIEKYYADPLNAGIKLLEALKKEYHLE